MLILWTKGLASVGSVAAAFAMSFRLMGLSHWIMYEMASLFENIGTVRDGIRILSKSFSVKDKQELPMDISSGEIIFENISFSYTSGKSVIGDLNLKINHGERVGLRWSFRWGKTTTMNLLLRFFDLNKGRILIDGVDIANVQQNSLRENIAMVTQDAALLHRSVRENIKYGNPNASEEKCCGRLIWPKFQALFRI